MRIVLRVPATGEAVLPILTAPARCAGRVLLASEMPVCFWASVFPKRQKADVIHDATVRGCYCVPPDRRKAYVVPASLFHQRAHCRAARLACRSVGSSSFGLSRPVRPRFGMSNRRPSSLRSASIKKPQRPFSAFFPWSLCAHSSRDKKASHWPPSTAWRPYGCGPIASGQRQPSRSRWSRPERRKRIRTWLPSATSP